jgi:hypothetical protein
MMVFLWGGVIFLVAIVYSFRTFFFLYSPRSNSVACPISWAAGSSITGRTGGEATTVPLVALRVSGEVLRALRALYLPLTHRHIHPS